jgi:hypothetical protein
MSDNPKCLNRGYLVGPNEPLPQNIKVYHNDQAHIIGCNRIYCSLCQNYVRQWAGYRLGRKRPHTLIEHKELDETQDPDASPYLTKSVSGESFRVYACQCWADEITFQKDLRVSYIERDSWSCGGHPQ